DKVAVLGILEAVETLLADGFTPARTICLAFGHDEEIDGLAGAAAIVKHFEDAGTRFEFVLDEGMLIVEGIIPGLDPAAALIGLSEKGFANVTLTVRSTGGHSSIPPSETAVGILSNAIARLEATPMEPRLDGPTREMFRWVAPEMSFGMRLVMGNLWLTGPLVRSQLAAAPATNAAIRTTAAPTMLQGSPKANVLAGEASAVINYRILPGDTPDDVLEHVRTVIDDDRVSVELGPGTPSVPSPVSSVDSAAFDTIAASVRAVFPEVVVAPSLVIPATDARYYARVADDAYRLLPIVVTSEDLDRFHGVNERIAVDGYTRGIVFYADLMRRAAGGTHGR
ncbi:MAG: M20/M25/M40 family metallo-hydrolase, partial [Acidobacteriota bacterium]|nr:M20/M25/M40 family metallo-hydrolase [Acidobacteriota bacterium]